MRIPILPLLAGVCAAAPLHAQPPVLTRTTYPPHAEYMMPRAAEIALARTAAPAAVSAHATVRVLTEAGYQEAERGDNGFVCMVMRGFAAPTFTPAVFRALVYYPSVRAPICYNPVAARTVIPYQELRARLAMEGKSPDQITAAVRAAYADGTLPRMEQAAFAYMFSAEQELGPGIGAYHPHVMVFTPNYENAMVGGNPFGGELPFVSDDAATPFAVTVIPVSHELAVGHR